MNSLFLHILSILLLSCLVHYTWGMKCRHGGLNGDLSQPEQHPDMPVEEKDCPNPTDVCGVVATAPNVDAATRAINFRCMDKPKPEDMKCTNLMDSEEGKKGNVGPTYCETDLCNTIDLLKENCKGAGGGAGGNGTGGNGTGSTTESTTASGGGGGGGGGAGLKCWSGSVGGPITNDDLGNQTKEDTCGKDKICMIRWTDQNGDDAAWELGCTPKPASMKCEKLLGDMPPAPPREVGVAYCEKALCNTPKFLKENCKGKGPDPSPGGSTTNSTGHYAHAPSYSAFGTILMAYALILTTIIAGAGVINSK